VSDVDDVLLVPAYSDVLPKESNFAATLQRSGVNIPLISAAMDSVTEARAAITMAREGECDPSQNLPVADQPVKFERVKRAESGMVCRR